MAMIHHRCGLITHCLHAHKAFPEEAPSGHAPQSSARPVALNVRKQGLLLAELCTLAGSILLPYGRQSGTARVLQNLMLCALLVPTIRRHEEDHGLTSPVYCPHYLGMFFAPLLQTAAPHI